MRIMEKVARIKGDKEQYEKGQKAGGRKRCWRNEALAPAAEDESSCCVSKRQTVLSGKTTTEGCGKFRKILRLRLVKMEQQQQQRQQKQRNCDDADRCLCLRREEQGREKGRGGQGRAGRGVVIIHHLRGIVCSA